MRNSDDQWIRGLEIPLEDIQRLSLRPLKWLRFVAFAVLGAKGRYHFVDPKGLADYITASVSTPRRHENRGDVSQGDDNRCVITRAIPSECHAAHIIPRSKGDQYLRFVISDRRNLYEDEQVDLRSDLNIDSPENGMFLRAVLHIRFGLGASVFLKTPNFALDPADIPRVVPGEIPASRTTIQHLEPRDPLYLDPVPQRDVQVDWTVEDAPPSILLDYVYGVAVIKLWATADIRTLLEQHETHFKIANTLSSIPEDNDDVQDHHDEPHSTSESQISEYESSQTVCHRGIHQTRTEAAQCQAIDTAFAFSMFIKGYSPGTTIDMILQKQEEEAETRSRQVAREKVQGWLETSK